MGYNYYFINMNSTISSLANLSYLIPLEGVQFDFKGYKYIVIIKESKRSAKYAMILRAINMVAHKLVEIDSHTYLLIGLNDSEMEMKILHFIVSSIRGNTNSYVFIDGFTINKTDLLMMLWCAIGAKNCIDPHAYCWKYSKDRITENKKNLTIKKRQIIEYLEIQLPCKHTLDFLRRQIPDNIKVEDAYQAYVMQDIFRHCPFFYFGDFIHQIIADELFE